MDFKRIEELTSELNHAELVYKIHRDRMRYKQRWLRVCTVVFWVSLFFFVLFIREGWDTLLLVPLGFSGMTWLSMSGAPGDDLTTLRKKTAEAEELWRNAQENLNQELLK